MTLFLALLLACGPTEEEPHGHDHDAPAAHEHEADHAHGDEAHHDTPAGPEPAAIGERSMRIEPTATTLRVVLTEADGKPATTAGEAKVVLTGTGEEEQRLVLTPDGEAWTAPANAEGAKGYTAVVSVEIDGVTEVARFAWGDVPAPKTHDHGDGGHDHGDGDHAH
ncbi:MAG: hypothetical protein KC912_14830 [Proteobacteria bacterium]|nr:hypothetical protein [Pseudomonadota bacterium]